jgi:hypothetical protein
MCTSHKIFFLSDQIDRNEMSGACSMYGGEQNYVQGFGGET